MRARAHYPNGNIPQNKRDAAIVAALRGDFDLLELDRARDDGCNSDEQIETYEDECERARRAILEVFGVTALEEESERRWRKLSEALAVVAAFEARTIHDLYAKFELWRKDYHDVIDNVLFPSIGGDIERLSTTSTCNGQ